jgi:hypothetical protein
LPGQDFESCASASSATSAIYAGLSVISRRLSITALEMVGNRTNNPALRSFILTPSENNYILLRSLEKD